MQFIYICELISIKCSNFAYLLFNAVTETSSTQTQQPIQLVTRSNLPKFLNESATFNTPPNRDKQLVQLNEEPLIIVPEKFKVKFDKNAAMLENVSTSFESFIRLNPPSKMATFSKACKKIESTMKPLQLPDDDTVLQKYYNPITMADFEVQASSFNHNMKCYINACISGSLTERAYATLKSITRTTKFNKFERAASITELYADVLAKYASIRNWTRVSEIYDILVAEKYPITPQIFMNILDCLGRMRDCPENIDLIRKFVGKANEQVNDH